MGAFKFTFDVRKIISARVAFGGMAATPKRGTKTEAALCEISIDDPLSWGKAIAMLQLDYQPIGDMRATADYRLEMAEVMLSKALTEIVSGQTRATRVAGHREAVA
jgi:xanthine dehydrogenase small subunit